jgi:hypothetical protein
MIWGVQQRVTGSAKADGLTIGLIRHARGEALNASSRYAVSALLDRRCRGIAPIAEDAIGAGALDPDAARRSPTIASKRVRLRSSAHGTG